MKNLYRDLYYNVYSWNLKQFGKNDIPEWKALIVVTFIMFANISTIGIILELFGLFNFFFVNYVPKKELIIFMGIIGAFNYFQFIYDSKYEQIVQKYDSGDIGKPNSLLLLLFVIISIALPFGISFIAGGFLK